MTANKAQVTSATSRTKRAPKSGRKASKKDVLATGVRRRDGGGHIDPNYRDDLIMLSSRPVVLGEAAPFIRVPRALDELAEHLGEHTVVAATTGESNAPDALDQDSPEDLVSPFHLAEETDEEEEEE